MHVDPHIRVCFALQVLSLVNASAQTDEDQYSQRVAATALAAVVPAWVAGGQDLAELWAVVVKVSVLLSSSLRCAQSSFKVCPCLGFICLSKGRNRPLKQSCSLD